MKDGGLWRILWTLINFDFRNHAGELHDLTFRNAAFTQDHYLNLSGGNDKGTFSSSLGYYSEDGQIISTNYQRVNGTINGSYKLLPVLTVNAGGSFHGPRCPIYGLTT